MLLIAGVVKLLREIHTQLHDPEGLYPEPTGRLLRDASTDLLDCASQIESSSQSRLTVARTRTEAVLDSLLALADEHINNTDFYLVASKWLSLYTDSSLLRAISALVCASENKRGLSLSTKEAIRWLDMAIIVAGAVIPRRMDWVQRAIALAQSGWADIQTSPDRSAHIAAPSRPTKRPRLDDPTLLAFAPMTVPALAVPPSLENYLVNYRERPFILPGYLANADAGCPPWQAMKRWGDPEYLFSRVGRGRWVPVEEGSAYDDRSWGQRIVPFEDFLRRAGFDLNPDPVGPAPGETRPMYLAQHSLFRQFPALERDIVIPDYAWSRPKPTADCTAYQPPANEDGLVINVWIGSGSGEIVSPAHTDPYYNCYAQVLGHKRVWLAPPRCSAYMQCHGSADSSDGNDLSTKYMGNTSRLPLLRPGVEVDAIAKRFPSFMEHVWPFCMEAVLGPGDLLIMPPGWWHAMRGEGQGPGWSVSMWY